MLVPGCCEEICGFDGISDATEFRCIAVGDYDWLISDID